MDYIKRISGKNSFGVIVIIIVWMLFSNQFLFFGKTTYPSDYQVNFFQPISQYPGLGGPVKNNAQPDIIGQIFPWKVYTIENLKKGIIPFWNPYSFSGTPHLANYQSAVLSPLNLLYFLPIKFIYIWTLIVVMQPLLAGIFTYLLTRLYKISIGSSLVSAFSFMFCGFMTTWMGYQTLGYAILLLPLSLYLIEKYIVSKKSVWLILLSISIFLSFTSGHFQTSLYFLITCIFYSIYKFYVTKDIRGFFQLLLYSLYGLLLSMPQILPSFELYFNSVRSGAFQKIEAIPLSYLPTFFAPDFFGNPVTRNDWFGHYAEWNGYAGSISICFAIFIVFMKRKGNEIFYMLLALFSLLLAFDTPILSLIVDLKIPVLSTSAASRVIVLFSFAVAILGGFGFDSFIHHVKKRSKKVLLWIGLVIFIYVLLGAVTFLNILPHDKLLIARKNLIIPFATVFILVILSVATILRKKVLIWAIWLIVILSMSEMIRFALKWQNFSEVSKVYKNVPIANFYKHIKSTERAVGLSGAEDALYYHVPILTGYDPLYIAKYGELIKFVEKGEDGQSGRSVVGFPLDGIYTSKALDFLGVRYIVHKVSDKNYAWAFPFWKYPKERFVKVYDDKYYQVFINKNSFPRDFLVEDVYYYPEKSILKKMFVSDLGNKAFISEKISLEHNNKKGSSQITSYEPNYLKIDVKSVGRKMLILTDNYYPGWNAYINKKPVRIYNVDYTFRGVIVPNGNSTVEFYYKPSSFYIGIYMALLGIMGIIVGGVIKHISKK